MKTTLLRPHRVLGKTSPTGDLHALSFTSGEFADIIFSYNSVEFNEDVENDVLRVAFEYHIHDVPHHLRDYDKERFKIEIGDFIIALLHYGIERDKLGYIDEQNREDDPFEFDAQRNVLSEGSAVFKD